MRFRPALGHQRVEQTCSNRAATRVNLLKGQEMRNRSNAAICGDLARSRKLQQTIRLLSHGRGRWFEPSIAHSEDTARAFSAPQRVTRKTKRQAHSILVRGRDPLRLVLRRPWRIARGRGTSSPSPGPRLRRLRRNNTSSCVCTRWRRTELIHGLSRTFGDKSLLEVNSWRLMEVGRRLGRGTEVKAERGVWARAQSVRGRLCTILCSDFREGHLKVGWVVRSER